MVTPLTVDVVRLEKDLAVAVRARRDLDDPEVGWLFIRERELPYGWTSTKRYAEITLLEVKVSERRTGVASALLDAARRWAVDNGFEGITVDSGAFDSDGALFYATRNATVAAITWNIPLGEVPE